MAEKDDQNWGRNLGYGLEIAVGVGLGYWIGSAIDHHYNCQPWGILSGVMLGMAGGMYMMIKDVIRMNKD